MTHESIVFKNREEAGVLLSQKLSVYKSKNITPVIFAMPEGGILTAYKIAEELSVPLDVVVARPIYSPKNSTIPCGAIAPGDVIAIDRPVQQQLGVNDDELNMLIAEQIREMEHQMTIYNSGMNIPEGAIDVAIIVDDGSHDIVTIRAAVESIKILHAPVHIVFASPVCSHDTAQLLGGVVDDIVCVGHPRRLFSIQNWYEELGNVVEREVAMMLHKARTFCTLPRFSSIAI